MTFRAAIISAGGTPPPIVTSLNRARPEFVLFLVSAESKRVVEEKVLCELEYQPQYNFVETPDAEHLGKTYEVLRQKIRAWLEERNLNPDQVYVDITPGTKAMSAALAMAAAEHFTHFTYVGGAERDKGGLGVVMTGTERAVPTINPWDALAVRERERATWLFRNGYAQPAADLLREASKKCNRELQQELLTLAALADLFADVDRFQFRDLKRPYEDHREALRLLFSHRSNLDLFERIEQAAAHWLRLQAEFHSEGTAVSATLRELLANAERRAQQGRYDDAIARLYRASELFAQGKLYEAFQAKLGKVQHHQIPQERRNEWVNMFEESEEGAYELGLRNAFKALAFSPNPEHQPLAGRYESIGNHLQKRNNSILAHGLRPCSKEAFAGFWGALLPVAQVREEDVPRWPGIDF